MPSACGPTSTEGQKTIRECSKIWSKNMWDLGYNELIINFDAPICFRAVDYDKLCNMYRIVHNHIYFLQSVLYPCSDYGNMFVQPSACTSSLLHSFVPSTISKWHSQPTDITHALTVNFYI